VSLGLQLGAESEPKIIKNKKYAYKKEKSNTNQKRRYRWAYVTTAV